MGASVLLLVTIVLVLIAAITLLIGIFGDNLALIFVSIGSSALAAIVLAVLSQASRRKARDEAMAATPAGIADVTPSPASVSPAAPPAAAAPVARAATATAAAAGATATAVMDLPIANYDSLRVNEILPSLEGLDLDQLEAVAQHEETTKNRTSILDRIDELMDELEAAEAAPATVMDAVSDAEADELLEDIEEGDVVPEAKVSSGFPIDDYDALTEAAIIASLGDLDADQLEEVAEYEETHANRDRVLDAIDDRLDVLEGIVAAPAATVAKAATKKAAKTAAAATKSATKKAASAPKKAATKVAAASPKKAATKTAAKATSKKASPAPAAATKKAAAVKKAGAVKKAAAPAKAATKTVKRAAKSTKKAR